MTQRITAMLALAGAMLMTTTFVLADERSLSMFLGDKGSAMPNPWYSPGKEPETSEQREARIHMIAELTVENAPMAKEEFGWYWSSDDLALTAFTKMYHESGHWDFFIHNGQKRGDHGHSTCLGQIWGGGNKLVGTDREHTSACIKAVMKHLTAHQHRCLNVNIPSNTWSMAQIFSGYGTGWSCKAGIYRVKKNALGVVMKGTNGEPIKDFWAQDRAAMWGRLRKAWLEQAT